MNMLRLLHVPCGKIICLSLNVFPCKWFHLKDLAFWHLVCARKNGAVHVKQFTDNTTPSPSDARIVGLFVPIGSRCQRSSKKRRCAQGISMLKKHERHWKIWTRNWNIPLAFRSTWPCLRRTCAGRALDSVLMWELGKSCKVGIVGCRSGLCKCVSHVIRDPSTCCDKLAVFQLSLRTSQGKPRPWQLRKNGALRIASLQWRTQAWVDEIWAGQTANQVVTVFFFPTEDIQGLDRTLMNISTLMRLGVVVFLALGHAKKKKKKIWMCKCVVFI